MYVMLYRVLEASYSLSGNATANLVLKDAELNIHCEVLE